jgi:EAL domain-containing protein (putative c-di-GMP-specific phosphodiesterase class I)/GGDEF domain-containing protein
VGQFNFDLAAILIILLNLFQYFSKRHLFTPRMRLFLALVLLSLGTTVLDVASVATYRNAGGYPFWLLYSINVLYYLFQNSVAPVFCVLILGIDGSLPKIGSPGRTAIWIPYLASVLVVASNPLTGFAFRFDERLAYARGPLVPALYAIAILYATVAVASLCVARRRLPRATILSAGLSIAFSLVPAAIQFLVPELLVQNLGIAVSELVILLTVNDSAKYVDRSSGLFNRNGLVAQLEIVVGRRRRASVFLVTLDNLDFLRHSLGPEDFTRLDQKVAGRLFGRPRSRRFASHLGAGQYALVLIDPGDARAGAERERLSRELTAPWSMGDRQLALHARLCEIRMPEDSDDVQKIFQAHHRLSLPRWDYPRNVILRLSDLSLADAGRQLAVAMAIQRALAGPGLDVYFQPIISARTREVVAVEALARLKDEELGWISPGEFIPIAERNGGIHRIGDFVVERASEVLSSLRAEGLALSYLEVNLSPVQCLQSHLDERLLAISRRHGLGGGDLCFEVTETAATLSPAAMRKNLEGLSASGFSLAIDDFGTGYSNISSLIEIPFRTVKLDRSLITAMGTSVYARIGIESATALFKRMGVTIIAEGVETAEQFELLRAMGVDLIQGYFFARPMPVGELSRFMREWGKPCT